MECGTLQDIHGRKNKKRLMMIALNQDPWARHLFFISVFYFDDSPSAKCQDHLPFLVNRFRFRVIKNGGIGFLVHPGELYFP